MPKQDSEAHLSTERVSKDASPPSSLEMTGVLRAFLEEAIRLDEAAMGNIQLFDPATESLRIVAQKGFRKGFLTHFEVVKPADSSACGRAAGTTVPVIISDVLTEPGFEEHRLIAKSAGFRSVKSTPIFDGNGRLLGMISTHCRAPRSSWDQDSLAGTLPKLAETLQSMRDAALSGPIVDFQSRD